MNPVTVTAEHARPCTHVIGDDEIAALLLELLDRMVRDLRCLSGKTDDNARAQLVPRNGREDVGILRKFKAGRPLVRFLEFLGRLLRHAPIGHCGCEYGVFGGDRNRVHLVSASGIESWPDMSKDEVARRLMERLVQMLPPEHKAAE